MSKKIVVMGTGRSGTKYVSDLLTEVGLNVTHEEVFQVDGVHDWGLRDGDASFAAAFYPLHVLGNVVYHIVRDPVKVLRSQLSSHYDEQLGHGFWGYNLDYKPLAPWTNWWAKYLPHIYKYENEIDRACVFMMHCTNRILMYREQQPYIMNRVEDIDAYAIHSLLDLSPYSSMLSVDQIQNFIDNSPTDTNTRPHTHDWLQVGDLMRRPLGYQLVEQYAHFGYEVETMGT